jgi:CDP-glucose 4,6-dehydratase
MTSIFGDLRNREALANVFADFQPEIVIHYATLVSRDRAKLDPVEAFATSVMGTVHILEEARHIDSIRAVVVANTGQGFDVLGGDHDVYRSSAACAELAASAYISEFFHDTRTAVATARTGSVIGGGDWGEGELVPEIVRGITSTKQIVVREASAVKVWQHVLEPVHAHLLLAQKLYEQCQEFSGTWNLAPQDQDEDAATVGQLAKTFVEHWGTGELTFGHDENSSPTNPVFPLNAHRMQSQLAWRPALVLEEAIAWTVEWYKAFYADPASSWRATEDQIQRYMRSSGR